MNPILHLIYQFLKLLTKISFRVFYPNAARLNLERLRYRGGSILVSNHPNTLLDPLNAACRVPKVVHFLANASLFQTPFTHWFFNTFFCIPVERPQDTKGKPINNANAFRKSQQFIAGGGCLYIAPEGGSEVGRQVRPFKTGTARIILGAEAQHDFQLGLRLLPVGLTYDQAGVFRSRMTVNAAPPIIASQYAGLYREDPQKAVRQLTQDLEEAVRSHAIDTRDEAENTLVLKAEKLLRNCAPVDGKTHFQRTKALIANLRQMEATQPKQHLALRRQLSAYFKWLEDHQTTDAALASPISASQWIKLFVGAPLAIYGWVNHVASYLPRLAAERLDIYEGYTATVKVLCGLAVFPVSYALQTWAVGIWLGTPAAIAYLASLPLSGWWFLKWRSTWQQAAARQRFLRTPAAARPLNKRKELVEWIEGMTKQPPHELHRN